MLLQWWTMLLVVGLAFLPVSRILFPKFLDRGYIFAKILGSIILSYTILVLGMLHIVPFTFTSVMILLAILGGVQWYFITRRTPSLRNRIRQAVKKHAPLLFVEELLFFLILLLFSYIRSFAPEINGLEKFMDYGFINSILQSTYFPPKDMWLTPLSINYYYFGHFVTAVLTQLSLLPSNYTYNLMLATLAGFCFVGSFSLGINFYNAVKPTSFHALRLLLIGLLSATLVTFAGNLHTIYTLFQPYENEKPQPITELLFSPLTFPNNYWYPNATRFIHNTIHEFPLYSWTVADLHGHVLDIPFVLLTIAVLFSFFQRYSEKSTNGKTPIKNRSHQFFSKLRLIKETLPLPIPALLFISFLLAILYMTNAWDGIIYFLLTILVVMLLCWQSILKQKLSLFAQLLKLFVTIIPPVLLLGVGFSLFSLPFSLFFKPFVSGIGILCAPEFLTQMGSIGPLLFEADHCQRSPLWQLLILHGFFFFFIASFLLFLLRTKKLFASDQFMLLLILLSLFLILIPELMYAKDIYPAHYRANTMFKLVFQSFIMLSLASAYIIPRISNHLKNGKTILSGILYGFFFITTLGLFVAVLSYPYFAINSYYNNVFAIDRVTEPEYKGLNGTKYLGKYPDDYDAITWILENIKGQPVILEAQGDSYTDYARVSSNTGLPTVLGWTVHEWLWRGSYDIPSPRIEDVTQMYELIDISKTKALLTKYDVKYVFLGELERQKYSQLNEEKFAELGSIVYQKGQTKIIKLD